MSNETLGLKKTAVSVILRSEGQVLLIHRNKAPLKGYHIPIGGKIDPHESPVQTAIREAKEEAGVTIDNPQYCGVITETSPSQYNWVVFFYLKDVAYFTPPPCDEGELHWAALDALHTLKMPQLDAFIFAAIAGGQHFAFDAFYDAGVNLVKVRDQLTGEIVFAR